jgi:hypothetical protein
VTSHLDEGILNSLLDGEIPATEIPALQAHLTSCDVCQHRLEESRGLRDEAFALIEVLDQPSAAPAGRPVVPLRSGAPARPRRVWMTGLAWAASVARAATAGLPVCGWRRAAPAGGDMLAADPGRVERQSTLDRGESAAAVEPDQAASRFAENRGLANARKAAAPPVETDLRERTTQPATADERARRDAPAEERLPSRMERADQARQSPTAEREQAAADAAAETGKRAAKLVAADSASPLARLAPAPAALSMTGATRAQSRPAAAVEAIRVLGGSLRLIEGMVPDHIAIVGDTVQVVYATSFGPLLLEQWRDGELRSRLVAPAAAPADSIAAWRRRTPGGGGR